MRVLLDSHVLVWLMVDDPRLGEQARGVIAATDSEVWASPASVWEIEIRAASGRLRLPGDLLAEVRARDGRELPITYEHAVQAANLPLHHNDPFDRMLVAQAQLAQLALLTADQQLARYDVEILPALA